MTERERVHFVTLPDTVQQKLEAEAKAKNLTLTQYLTNVLTQARLEEPEEEPEEARDVVTMPPSFDPARGIFVPSDFEWEWTARLERAILRTHTLAIADHGIGKTITIFKLAKKHNARVWYFTASYGLERGVLEGQHFPKPNGHPISVQDPDGHWHVISPPVSLQAVDGFITSAIEAGRHGEKAWLVVDEFFFLAKDVEPNLFAAMDTHQGIYSIAYRGGSVRVGPEFRVIGSTNAPSPMYPEAETSNRALLSRFGAIILIPFPSKTELGRYLGFLARGLPKELQKVIGDNAPRLVRFCLQVRQAQEKGELDNFVSPRDLTHFVNAVSAVGIPKSGNEQSVIEEALDETVFPKFAPRYIPGVKDFWKLAAGTS